MPVSDYENNPARRGMVDAVRWPGFQWERQADKSFKWNFVTKEKVLVNGKTKKRQGSKRLDGTTEEQALNDYKIKVGKQASGEVVVPRGDITLKHVCDAALAELDGDVGKIKADATWVKADNDVRVHILPFFGESKRFADIGAKDLEELLDHVRYEKGRANWTVLNLIKTLRLLWRTALYEQWVTVNSVDLIRAKHIPPKLSKRKGRAIGVADFAKMIEKVSPTYLNLLIVLGCTGLRISELCGLKWENVDVELNKLLVEEQITQVRIKDEDGNHTGRYERVLDQPKGKRANEGETRSRRWVLLLPLAIAALERQRFIEESKGFGRPGDFVFTTSDGSKQAGLKLGSSVFSGAAYRQDNIRNRGVKKAAEDAGLGHVLPHDLRHTTASMLAKAGVNETAAARMLGHTTQEYHDTYVHPIDIDEELAELSAALTGLGFGVDLTAPVEIEEEA